MGAESSEEAAGASRPVPLRPLRAINSVARVSAAVENRALGASQRPSAPVGGNSAVRGIAVVALSAPGPFAHAHVDPARSNQRENSAFLRHSREEPNMARKSRQVRVRRASNSMVVGPPPGCGHLCRSAPRGSETFGQDGVVRTAFSDHGGPSWDPVARVAFQPITEAEE
nr:hypothetical protein GCM10020241_63920 [Streptoalloteichus tenebrarius]